MKNIILLTSLILTSVFSNAQNVGVSTNISYIPTERLDVEGNIKANGIVYWGNSLVRTESRNDAGLQGNVGAMSGFYETAAPSPATNWPVGAASWWHLLDVRHSNAANNYAMQIAGSFFDQNLYFRKTNGSATTAWSQILTTSTPLNQNYNTTSSSTEILLTGNNTGGSNVNLAPGAGWTPGTWQSTGISVVKNIPTGHFAMITLTARVEGDNYYRCPPSSSFFRITRNGVVIGTTAVYTRHNSTGGYWYISSNLAMYLTDNVTGNNTYLIEYWLANDNSDCSVESINIGDYMFNVIQIKQ